MGLSDILAGLSGAIHGAHNYDEDEEAKARQKRDEAMKALMFQMQVQEHMDKMGATPYSADKALSTSLGGRPDVSDTVGLTDQPIKQPKTLDQQPFMKTAPSNPMGLIANTPIPPAPPPADSRRSRAMNAVAQTSGSSRAPMTPTAPDAMAMLTGMKPRAALSSNDGREERLVNEKAMSGPRVTMPNAITGANDEYSLYPGGSTQRAEDIFSSRQADTEQRQRAVLEAKAKIDQARADKINKQDYANITALASEHPEDRDLQAFIKNKPNGDGMPEGHFKGMLELLYRKYHDLTLENIRARGVERGYASQALAATKAQVQEDLRDPSAHPSRGRPMNQLLLTPEAKRDSTDFENNFARPHREELSRVVATLGGAPAGPTIPGGVDQRKYRTDAAYRKFVDSGGRVLPK